MYNAVGIDVSKGKSTVTVLQPGGTVIRKPFDVSHTSQNLNELAAYLDFQGKPAWALNREHLAYLIDYLSADLREKPMGRAKKTQADHLPTFMKTAKNRERIVKLLKKMQEE